MKNIFLSDKISIAQKPPRGYFVRYAKRYSKIPFFLRGNAFNAFRRDVADSAFLQTDCFKEAVTGLCALRSKESKLSDCRIILSADVCHHHGASADQQDGDTAIQRRVSGNAGAESFSRPVNTAQIFETSFTGFNTQAGAAA